MGIPGITVTNIFDITAQTFQARRKLLQSAIHRRVDTNVKRINAAFVYDPSPATYSSDLKSRHEAIRIPNIDGNISGFMLKPEIPSDRYLLYLRGGNSNINDWIKAAKSLERNVPVNILIIDYRGSGESTLNDPSNITLDGLTLDAEAAYNWILRYRQSDESKVSICGRSIGGALAIDIASKRNPGALILQSTFRSHNSYVRHFYPKVSGPIIDNKSLVSNMSIRRYAGSVLISHGTSDDVIPFQHSEDLMGSANMASEKSLVLLPGADHGNFSSRLEKHPEYYPTFRKHIGLDS